MRFWRTGFTFCVYNDLKEREGQSFLYYLMLLVFLGIAKAFYWAF